MVPRSTYATDSSNYRQVPLGVVVPRSVDDAVRAVRACQRHGAPVLSRGGGTSLAGQSTNAAVVLDWTKYCHRLVSVDPEARTCVVEPGIALDDLNAAAGPARADVRPAALHPPQLHHRRHDRQQLLRRPPPRPTARRWTTCAASRCSPTTASACGSGPTTDEDYVEIVAARRPAGGDLPAAARAARRAPRADPDPLPRHPAPGVRLQPRLAAAGGRLRPGPGPGRLRGNAASPSCTPSWSWFQCRRPRPWWCSATPTSPPRRTRCRSCSSTSRGCSRGWTRCSCSWRQSAGLAGDAIARLPAGGGWLMVQFAGDDQDEADERAAAAAGRRLGGRLRPDGEVPGRPREGGAADQGARVRAGGDRAPARAARHLAGLGGLRRPAGPARRLPARPARAARRVRLRPRRDRHLRPLRPGLRPHPDPVRAADGRRGTPLPRRSSSGRPTWWCRYGGSLSGEHGDGQARGELLPRCSAPEVVRALRAGQGGVRPGRPDEPRQGGAAEPAGRGPAARHRTSPTPSRRRTSPTPTTSTASPGRRCAASASGTAAATAATAR